MEQQDEWVRLAGGPDCIKYTKQWHQTNKKAKKKNVEVLFWQGFGILWESLKLGKNTISSMGKQNCQTVKLKNGQHSV